MIGDFATIDRYAERLGRLTFTEVASWQSSPNADYVRNANAFVKGVQTLRERSAKLDLDGATDAYLSIVSSCAQCHRQVRGMRRVSLTLPAPSGINPPEGGAR